MQFSPLPHTLAAPVQAGKSDNTFTNGVVSRDTAPDPATSFSSVLEADERLLAAQQLTKAAVALQADVSEDAEHPVEGEGDQPESKTTEDQDKKADATEPDKTLAADDPNLAKRAPPETAKDLTPDKAASDIKIAGPTGISGGAENQVREQMAAFALTRRDTAPAARGGTGSVITSTGQETSAKSPTLDAMGREIVQTDQRREPDRLANRLAESAIQKAGEVTGLTSQPSQQGARAQADGKTVRLPDQVFTQRGHPMLHISDQPDSQPGQPNPPRLHVSDDIPAHTPRLHVSDDGPALPPKETRGPTHLSPLDIKAAHPDVSLKGVSATGVATGLPPMPPGAVLPTSLGEGNLRPEPSGIKGSEAPQTAAGMVPITKPVSPKVDAALNAVKEVRVRTVAQPAEGAQQQAVPSSPVPKSTLSPTPNDGQAPPLTPVLHTDVSPRRQRKLALTENKITPTSTPKEPQQPALQTALVTPLIAGNPVLGDQNPERQGADPVPMGLSEFSTASAPLTNAVQLTRADLPQHIARQLAEVVGQIPARPVDITLNPEELGRVRLSVTASEAGVIVNVLAERPDTLELMRRHIDLLGQEFRNLGYSNIAFSFEGRDGDDSTGEGSGNPHSGTGSVQDNANNSQPAAEIHLASGATSGLDLRL